MFRFDRAMPIAFILAFGLSLSACSSSGSSFDPFEFFSTDWFGSKPKLPGDRKPVFPEGVPGVPEGVPPELVKGNQQAAAEAEAAAATAAPPPTAKPAPARTAQPAKPKPQPRTAASRPAAQQPSDQSAAPWPDPATGAQPASPPQQNAWPPPDTNTFSR